MKKEILRRVLVGLIVAIIMTIIVDQVISRINIFGKMKPIVQNQRIRGCDQQGCGYFGANRGDHVHKGIDIVCGPGELITSPISGKVTRHPSPYSSDPRFHGIEIVNPQYKIKIFYIEPIVAIGNSVKAGQAIGIAQNIAGKYGSGMTNHVHLEVYNIQGTAIDPQKLFA